MLFPQYMRQIPRLIYPQQCTINIRIKGKCTLLFPSVFYDQNTAPLLYPQKYFKSASASVTTKSTSDMWEVLTCWHKTPRMENHSLTEVLQYASAGKAERFENLEGADLETRDYQLYSLDFHRDLEAIHGIKTNKVIMVWPCAQGEERLLFV